MGTNFRPFRVAFWVLLAAFALSLLVIASNPRTVRLAIIAKSRTNLSPLSPETAVAETSSPSIRPDDEHPAATEVAESTSTQPSQPTVVVEQSSWPEVATASIATHRISSSTGQVDIAAEASPRRQAVTMPVLSPAKLQASQSRGGYFELPPPPQGDEFSASLSANSAPLISDDLQDDTLMRPSSDARDAEFQSARLIQEHLQAEIVSLRREIDRLADAQKVGEQLDRLEHEQQQLLRMHQELPVDRMMQLVDLLLVQLQSVRETIPERPGPSCPECATIEGEVSQPGNGRISLRITEAQLEDVLRMFSQLSGKSIVVDGKQQQQQTTAPDEAAPLVEQHSSFRSEMLASAPELPPPSPANPPSSRPLSDLIGSSESAPTSLRPVASSSRCAACHPNHVAR